MAEELNQRKITATKDALYDFLFDLKPAVPDKTLEIMARNIVMTIKNVK